MSKKSHVLHLLLGFAVAGAMLVAAPLRAEEPAEDKLEILPVILLVKAEQETVDGATVATLVVTVRSKEPLKEIHYKFSVPLQEAKPGENADETWRDISGASEKVTGAKKIGDEVYELRLKRSISSFAPGGVYVFQNVRVEDSAGNSSKRDRGIALINDLSGPAVKHIRAKTPDVPKLTSVEIKGLGKGKYEVSAEADSNAPITSLSLSETTHLGGLGTPEKVTIPNTFTMGRDNHWKMKGEVQLPESRADSLFLPHNFEQVIVENEGRLKSVPDPQQNFSFAPEKSPATVALEIEQSYCKNVLQGKHKDLSDDQLANLLAAYRTNQRTFGTALKLERAIFISQLALVQGQKKDWDFIVDTFVGSLNEKILAPHTARWWLSEKVSDSAAAQNVKSSLEFEYQGGANPSVMKEIYLSYAKGNLPAPAAKAALQMIKAKDLPTEEDEGSLEDLDSLFKQLGSVKFDEREEASRALLSSAYSSEEVQKEVLAGIQKAKTDKDLEIRARAEKLGEMLIPTDFDGELKSACTAILATPEEALDESKDVADQVKSSGLPGTEKGRGGVVEKDGKVMPVQKIETSPKSEKQNDSGTAEEKIKK